MDENKTIAQVVKDGLCTGCGTCIALCPNSAIKLTMDEKKGIYVPKIDEEKCKNCEICFEVCPGHEVDFECLNLEIFGKEPGNILIGNYLDCYIGHSTDYDIRYNSASGGLVSQLLIFALEEGMIDGALVTRMKRDKPLEPEPFIARTKEEIIEASKSKYCPVPANIALKEILESEEGEKFAVVGLPCHIHGIRKAMRINKKLKERIILNIGIFCSHTPNFFGTEFFLEKLKIKKGEVAKLDYRGNGWPGSMRIGLKERELLLRLQGYWSFVGSDFFVPNRCLLCSDGVNELADISFGDAWLPGLSEDKIGNSIIVSKSTKGEEILQMMNFKNKIRINRVAAEKVVQSQRSMIYSKKKNLKARIKLLREDIRYNNILKPTISDYLYALYLCLNQYMFSKLFFRKCLKYTPMRIIQLYRSLFTLIFTLLCSRRLNISRIMRGQ